MTCIPEKLADIFNYLNNLLRLNIVDTISYLYAVPQKQQKRYIPTVDNLETLTSGSV